MNIWIDNKQSLTLSPTARAPAALPKNKKLISSNSVNFQYIPQEYDRDEIWAHGCANTDETAGDGILKIVLLGFEGDDAGIDGLAGCLALGILCHDARSDLHLLAHP